MPRGMLVALLGLPLAATGAGCGDDDDTGLDTGTDADSDADTDADTDANSDADADADSDADTDADADADTDTAECLEECTVCTPGEVDPCCEGLGCQSDWDQDICMPYPPPDESACPGAEPPGGQPCSPHGALCMYGETTVCFCSCDGWKCAY